MAHDLLPRLPDGRPDWDAWNSTHPGTDPIADHPPVPLASARRIRALVGLDRTTVANRCPRCGDELTYDTDDYGTGVRVYLDCLNPDCDYPGECA